MLGVISYYDAAFIEPHPINDEGVVHEDAKLVITARRLSHTIETFGYRVEGKDSVNMDKEELSLLGLKGLIVGDITSHHWDR